MSCRSRMTHRAFIQRNGADKNIYGHKSPQGWAALSTTPCYAWTVTGDTKNAPEVSQDSTSYKAIMPLDTDITSDDRLEKVENRIEAELFGVLYIDAVLRRRDHFEIRMRDHE